MEPYNLEMLYKSFTKYSNEVVLYLPRNSDLNQIARYGQDGKKLEVAHYAIMGASKVHYILHGLPKTLLTWIRPCVFTLETSSSTWKRRRKNPEGPEQNRMEADVYSRLLGRRIMGRFPLFDA
jgi:hypothetical protein